MYLTQIIKKNKFLYEMIQSYRVRYRYGYLTTKVEVNNLYKKLTQNHIGQRKQYNPNKPDKFIFIGDRYEDSTMKVAVFGDIEQGMVMNHECEFWVTHKLKKASTIHEVFWTINHFIPLPGKRFWEEKYTTSELNFSEEYNYFLIFLAGGYFEETFSQPKLWEKVFAASEKTFCSRNLYLVDPVDKFPTITYWFDFFDTLSGCAWEDTERYGLNFIDTPCVYLKKDNEEIKRDIYIRAMDNGRLSLIEACYDYLNDRGVECDFHVISDKVINRPGLACSDEERLEYTKMVEEELSSNTLLEIVTPNVGAGSTLRYREAVMYGKKLLTNNPTIKELTYYDGDNIRYFEKIEDISIAWIKRQEKCEYNYQWDFSTDTFCERIKKIGIT